MRFRLFLLSVIIIYKLNIYSQIYGKVNNQVINDGFIYAEQLINYDFSYNNISSIFVKNIEKYYVLNKIKAEHARVLKLDADSISKAEIELIKEIAVEKYLALKYDQYIPKSINISEEEIRNYYLKHKDEFVTHGQYSFLQAMIFDNSDSSISEVKKKIKFYAADQSMLDNFKLGNKDRFIISYERDRTIYQYMSEFKVFKNLSIMQFSDIITNGEYKYLYYILTKKDPVLQSYDEVKEICKSRIMSEKLDTINSQNNQILINKYKINIDYNYFNK